MKDFFDVFYLAQTFDFDGNELYKAIKETLQNRKTEYNKDSFIRLLQLAENKDIQIRWRHFQKTINQISLSLLEVISLIDIFLHPVFDSLVLKEKYDKKWNAKNRIWM